MRQLLALSLTILMATGTGCYTNGRRALPPSSTPPDPLVTQIIGITTTAGEDVRFDFPANISNGQVVGWVKMQERHIPFAGVQRYWVRTRQFSKPRTAALVGGIAAAVVVTVGIIALARDLGGGSWGGGGVGGCCLYVYSWDGSQYTLDTETATAAITRGLERDDFAVLQQLHEQDGEYRLLLSNDQDETQYTDMAELWVVDHERGQLPRAAADGTLYASGNPLPPLEARDARGNDLLRWLSARDRLIWEPEPDAERAEIVLTFPKSAGARTAKLLTSATLTPWAGVMGARLLGLLGRDLPAWYERIDHDPAARKELTDWMAREEMFALKIWVEEPSGWQVRGMMPVAGPFVSDERVVPIDVSRVPGDRVRIRLRPAAGFWAFNSFAVDYGDLRPLHVTKVAAIGALRASDGEYLVMTEQGQQTPVTFAAPPRAPGLERTVFLHSRGYYHVNLPADGEPDLGTYQQILQTPGAGAAFSAALYAQFKQTQ